MNRIDRPYISNFFTFKSVIKILYERKQLITMQSLLSNAIHEVGRNLDNDLEPTKSFYVARCDDFTVLDKAGGVFTGFISAIDSFVDYINGNVF